MQKTEAAMILAGITPEEKRQAYAPTNLHVITGTIAGKSDSGKTKVLLDGLVFTESNNQYVEIDTLGGLEEGDVATILLTGESGRGMVPLAMGAPGSIDRIDVRIGKIEADYVTATVVEATYATIENLNAAQAIIEDLSADHVTVSDFEAEQAKISALQASTADIDTIRANSAKVANLTAAQLEADHAKVGTLDSTYATIENLTTANGRIDNLQSSKANVSDLTAATARIGDLEATRVRTTDLEADYLDADTIEAQYAKIDFSNTDVAWIENGVIKDGSITNAMINSVSANKLTAGTIDASNITVTNLNADNITTGTINGQRIGEGSLSLSKLEEDVYTEGEVDAKLAAMQSEIDGAIETWTGTAVPTLQNAPAVNWSTNSEKDTHVGDVYFVVNSNSQQNGYNYRFTKSGSTYSWQLIKDSDVTNALARLATAEGKITTFDSDISTLKTDTGTLTTKTTQLETSLGDKVDTSTFNSLSDTVDGHTQSITQLTNTVSSKADGSTVTALTTRVSTNEQSISGINTTIGQLQSTVEAKADSLTVTTISNRLNTVSDTVDGHTQSITSITNTLSTKADGSTVSGLESQIHTISDTVDEHTEKLTSVTNLENRLERAETMISANSDAIDLKADAESVYTKVESDAMMSTLTTEIESHQAEIEAAQDQILATVSENYTTKIESATDFTESGTQVYISSSADAPLKSLTIHGLSVQDGTPTPEAPIPIVSAGPPNLSPFFSHNFDDTNYWKTRNANYLQLDDGWAHLEVDRTSSTSNETYYFAVEPLNGLVAGDTYTVLTEVRNLDSLVDTTNNAVHASYSARQLNTTSTLSYATVTRDYAAYYQQVTVADPSAAELIRGRAYVYAGNSLSFDIRISVYKGAYKEPYVPCDFIGIFIRGKNLFGPRTAGEGTAGGVDWSIDESGTCVISGTATSTSTFTPVANIYLPEGTYTLSASDEHEVQFDGVTGQHVTKTFESRWDISLAKVYVRKNTTYSGSFTIQLERGDTATEYEPYRGAITTIPINGHELRSLPDGTHDELIIDIDGHVTMAQRVGCASFDGSESWVIISKSSSYSGYTGSYFGYTNSPTDSLASISGGLKAMSNKYLMPNPQYVREYADNNAVINDSSLSGVKRVYVFDSTLTSSADDFKAVLAGSPMKMIYPLATPQVIDLGTIDMPEVQDGDVVEIIASLTPSIDATWWGAASQAVVDMYKSVSAALALTATSITSTVESVELANDAIRSISTQIEQTGNAWTMQFNQLMYGSDEAPSDESEALQKTLKQAFDELGVTTANVEELRDFVQITEETGLDGQLHPVMLMGAANSPIIMALSNDSLEFRHGSTRVAYIDVDSDTHEGMLHITRAVVVKELQFGSWKWFERANGNMALKWVGGE